MKVAAAILALLMLTSCGDKAPSAPSAFDGFLAETTREILSDSPELATDAELTPDQVGVWFADRLDDRGATAVELRRGAALRRYAQTRAVDRATLPEEQRVTYDALAAQFAASAGGARFAYGRFSALNGFSPYVISQVDGAYLTLPGFFAREVPVRSLDDAELYVKRLSLVAAAIDAETARARADARNGAAPPDFVIDRASGLIAGFIATPPQELPYVSALNARLEALLGPPPAAPAPETKERAQARALLQRATDITATKIVPAYRRAYAGMMEARARSSAEPGVWRLPDGDAYYQAALAAQTSTRMTPDEVHELGLARVRQLSAETDMMLRSRGLTDGTVGARLALLTTDPRHLYPADPEGRAAALADAQARIASVEGKLGRWFRSTPKVKVEVRPAPAYIAAAYTGGFYQSPPLGGGGPGAFVMNVEHNGALNRIDLATLVYHETWPGHHLQVGRAIERKDLPVLRRMIGFNAFTEGWATYAEQLADEMGLYEGDPIGRIGYLRWQLWRAARLVVDTGIHAKRWSKAQAIQYLVETTGDAPSLIETEVERYAVTPGQACGYEIGRMEIARLRDRARAALGARFDIRDFHEAILAEGDLPLSVLAYRVDAWLATRGGGKTMSR